MESDRQKLGPVLLKAVQRKLRFLLRSGNLVGYRTLLNHQPLFLRGFDVEIQYDLIPGFEALPCLGEASEASEASLIVSQFLYQNGFSKVAELDKVGWTPLHYAGCRGEPELVRALLAHRANPNVMATKDNVMAGALRKWRVMTSVAALRHHEVAHILIEAKADLSGTQLVGAAIGNDPEGIRILCEVGGVSPYAADDEGGFGVKAITLACMYGAEAAVEALFKQAARVGGRVDLSNIFWLSCTFGNAGAKLVDTLLEVQADLDERGSFSLKTPLGLLFSVLALKYRLGSRTRLATMSYHRNGATPLIQAVLGGQWEAAATLIARGARVDLRNSLLGPLPGASEPLF